MMTAYRNNNNQNERNKKKNDTNHSTCSIFLVFSVSHLILDVIVIVW